MSDIGEHSETPLIPMQGLSAEAVDKLGQQWITTVEQLIAQSATPAGSAKLAEVIGYDLGEYREMIDRIKLELAPEIVADLEKDAPLDKGMGALKPPDSAE